MAGLFHHIHFCGFRRYLSLANDWLKMHAYQKEADQKILFSFIIVLLGLQEMQIYIIGNMETRKSTNIGRLHDNDIFYSSWRKQKKKKRF